MEKTLDKQMDKEMLDRVQVVTMLYDGAANFTRIARKKLETGDMSGKSFHISKASAIIKELSNSLNMDGGEISQNLKKLYDFVLTSYGKAEANNDVKSLDDAEKIIEILSGAWKEMQQSEKF